MNSRLALLAALLALAAVLFLVFQDGGAGDGFDSQRESASETGATTTDADALHGETERSMEDGPARESMLPAPTEEALDAAASDGMPAFRGVVVDSQGRPLADVAIEALGYTQWGLHFKGDHVAPFVSWSTTTGANGSFSLPSPPRDNLKFAILLRHPEFAPLDLDNQPATPGRTRDLGTLALNHGYHLDGRVLDPRGQPIAGAEVSVYRDLGNPKGVRFLNLIPPLEGFTTTTDGEGHFSFDRLPSGAVRFLAKADGYFQAWSGIANAVADGRGSGLEITLREGRQLEGVVMDQNRRSLAAARVVLQSQGNELEDSYEVETVSDAQGRFLLPAPLDLERATLTAAADGFFLERRRLKAQDVLEPQELLLTPAPELRGVVVDSTGRAVAGATVRLVEQGQAKLDPRTMAANDESISGADGSFTLHPKLRSAWGGRFTVYAWDETHAVAQSDSLRLAEAANYRPAELRLVLTRGFQVRGLVRAPAGAPLPQARVVLRQLRYQRKGKLGTTDPARLRGGDIFATTVTDQAGQFHFDGLASADYRLEAHGLGLSPVQSEDFNLIDQDFETELQLVEEAAIVGEVHGDRAAFARLRVRASSPGLETVDTMVDGEGRFRLPAMMPGTWSVELHEAEGTDSLQGFLYANTPPLARADGVEVVAGQETPLSLELSLAGRSRLVGSVRINGEAATGYQVFLLPQIAAQGGDPRLAARNLKASIRAAEVDFNGGFLISGIDSGDYWAVVMPPAQYPQGMWNQEEVRGLARQAVALRDGAESQLRFDITLGNLRINVSNRGNRSRVDLIPSPDDGRLHQSRYIGRSGFTFYDLPAGGYELRVAQAERGSWRSSHIQVPAGGTGQVDIELPMQARERSR